MGITIPLKSTIAFDTAPLIYLIEKNPAYIEQVRDFFHTCTSNQCMLVTSLITYIEVLTIPQKIGNQILTAKYRSYFTNSEFLSIYPLNIQVADKTVQFRAQYGFKAPDAIQLAIASISGADFFLTNDYHLKKCAEVNVILVGEL